MIKRKSKERLENPQAHIYLPIKLDESDEETKRNVIKRNDGKVSLVKDTHHFGYYQLGKIFLDREKPEGFYLNYLNGDMLIHEFHFFHDLEGLMVEQKNLI